MKKQFFSLAIVTVASLNVALGQQGGTVTTPINNWSYVGHSSTAAEGLLRGQAVALQAIGQANYLHSLAAVNYQEANKRALENSKLYTQVVIEKREMIKQHRDRYASVPLTREQLDRIAANSVPDRLTPEQVDQSSGKLVWPHILRMDEYKAVRDRIDELFVSRTPENSGNGSPVQRELDTLIDAMRAILKANSDKVSVSQFADANWFLVTLDYEVKFSLAEPTVSVPAVAEIDTSASDLKVIN